MTRSYVLNRVPIKRRERFTKGGTVYAHPKTVADEKAVWAAYKGPRFDADVPLAVRIDVYRALPKDRPRRIESEPDTLKPDVDNIAKAVLDGLQDKKDKNGNVLEVRAFPDDKQVVALTVVKHDRIRKPGDSIRFTVEEVRGYGQR